MDGDGDGDAAHWFMDMNMDMNTHYTILYYCTHCITGVKLSWVESSRVFH